MGAHRKSAAQLTQFNNNARESFVTIATLASGVRIIKPASFYSRIKITKKKHRHVNMNVLLNI